MLVAKAVWGEARGLSEDEWKLVVWCICNRVDSQDPDFAEFTTIEAAVTASSQFQGYVKSNPVDEKILAVVTEVLTEWSEGKEALILAPYATTSEYTYFTGDGKHNYFREEW